MPELLRAASEKAHRHAVESDIADVASYLREVLGQKLVAYLAGVADPKTVSRWAAGERSPRVGAEERLRGAYQIFHLLLTEESPHTVRAWFIGLNPQLDDEAPLTAIREGRVQDAWIAAKAFLAGA